MQNYLVLKAFPLEMQGWELKKADGADSSHYFTMPNKYIMGPIAKLF